MPPTPTIDPSLLHRVPANAAVLRWPENLTFHTVTDTNTYRDTIATVDERGKRVWIYPKQPAGRFYRWRTQLSYVLLAVLFGLPFVRFNGKPLVLLDVLDRNFIIFGLHFTPQDFHLFVLAMLTFMVFIVLFTVVYGRLFCGWVCPQTIFMEMVFRKIEYCLEGDGNAQRRLAKAPWNWNKAWRKGLKQVLFLAVSFLVAHTFLSYLIGVERVLEIVSQPPAHNWGGFAAMVAFTGAFYFVFSWMREQVCIAVCPYGRLQGVLLDRNSIAVIYDYVRGEPRGKIKKSRPKPASACGGGCDTCGPVLRPTASAPEPTGVSAAFANGNTDLIAALQTPVGAATAPRPLGDCIDCTLCVQVCPTGIDIRNGTQLECVNCTACIDACDAVMDKIGRPRGLIRYDSEGGVATGETKLFTGRVKAYTAVLGLLLVVNLFLFGTRTDVETLILRTPGMLYQEVGETDLSNLYNYQLTNRTTDSLALEFHVLTPGYRLRYVGRAPRVAADGNAEGAFFLETARVNLDGRKNTVKLEVRHEGRRVDRVTTNFLGPNK